MTPGATRKVGRPPLTTVRRAEIVDAFITLLADRGLEGVTLDDVAVAAGMQRSAVRHYVGNRQALITATMTELVDRYEHTLRTAVGTAPGVDDLVDALFGPVWVSEMPVQHAAFDVLVQQAVRDTATRALVRRAYDSLLAEVEDALRRCHPSARPDRVADVAYAITCLAEHNVLMQQLGYPSALARSAAATARGLASQLSP